MTVTFTMEAMKPRARRTKSGKPAKPRAPKVERPTITVQSRGEEVLVWIDAREKWAKIGDAARALRDLAITLLGPLTFNRHATGHYNLIATGPRLAKPGESRRSAMLRVVSTLRLAAKKTHAFAPFVPTAAELGPLKDDALRNARREWRSALAVIVRTGDQEAAAKREEKRLEREGKKREREEKRAAKAAAKAKREAEKAAKAAARAQREAA